jgi:hypothetical protein
MEAMKLQNLPEDKIRMIAKGILKAYNVSFVPDSAEIAFYEMIIKKAFKALDDELPQWVISAIIDAATGAFGDQSELDKIIQTFTDQIHDVVDRWWLPDRYEKRFIETLLKVIFYFTRQGTGLASTNDEEVEEVAKRMAA